MNHWWWVRHAPTHEKRFVGWRDVGADLSDSGGLRRLREYLPTGALLVSSDLRRARITADAIGAGRQRLADAAALREFDFGEWDGLDFDAVVARDPDLSRAFWENPGDVAPPGGESWNQVAARVAGFVDRVNRRHPGRHVVAVAHIGVIMTQIGLAGNMGAVRALGQRIDNLSVTRTCWDGQRWRIGVINHNP